MRATLELFYQIVRKSNKIIHWSKHLSIIVFKVSKPGELIAYVSTSRVTRGRSRRSSDRSAESKTSTDYAKGDSLNKLVKGRKAPRLNKDPKGPTPKNKDRADVSVFS